MSMNFILSKYRNPVFIETGTGEGGGVERALRSRFGKIYSIELSEKRYKNCSLRFKEDIQEGRIELFLGDSADCLDSILKRVDSRATFWLDAHYSGPETESVRGDEDVPLMRELEVISKHYIKDHTIMIDDLRIFGTNCMSSNQMGQFSPVF